MLQTNVPEIGGADIHSPDKFLTFHQLIHQFMYQKLAEDMEETKEATPNHFNLYLKCSNIIILINQCQQTYQGLIFSTM